MASAKRGQILVAARACLGTPFRHQGRLPGVGLDCVGLLVYAARVAGVRDYDYAAYDAVPADGLLERHLARAGLAAAPLGACRPGDVLGFRFDGGLRHLALASSQGMIHADRRLGRVVEHRLAGPWLRRLAAVYVFPEID